MRLLAFLSLLLLTGPVHAGCTIFAALSEVDQRANEYFYLARAGGDAPTEALHLALARADHLMRDFDLAGLERLVSERRRLMIDDLRAMTEGQRDQLSVALHRTRASLIEYGEAWGCTGGHQGGRIHGLPAADNPAHVERAAGGRRSAASLSNSAAATFASRQTFGWTALGVGFLVIALLVLLEKRRSAMNVRHVSGTPCILQVGAAEYRTELVDISRAGAKVRKGGLVIPPDGVFLHLGPRRIAFEVSWQRGNFMDGRFARPLPRRWLLELPLGVQARPGPAARGAVSSESPPHATSASGQAGKSAGAS